MTIRMYDLAGADPSLRFSPFCWRTKMALLHKGLHFEALPWRFTEKSALVPTGSDRVPVIEDKGRWVKDSWTIALYLDEAYPDRPKLMADEAERAAARLAMSWCDMALHLPIARYCMLEIHNALRPEDQPYFRSSRERRFGATLEAVCADPAGARKQVAQSLAPAEQTLADHAFFGGGKPAYADYALFGTLMWPYVTCREPMLAPSTNVARWFDRMLGLHGGYASRTPVRR